MAEIDSTASKYATTIRDARGTVIGENNTIYQIFLNNQYAPLAHKLITFTTLIEEKTRGFVGRRFVFDALNQFRAKAPSGYFIIKGEAGIGKSALMPHLVLPEAGDKARLFKELSPPVHTLLFFAPVNIDFQQQHSAWVQTFWLRMCQLSRADVPDMPSCS